VLWGIHGWRLHINAINVGSDCEGDKDGVRGVFGV